MDARDPRAHTVLVLAPTGRDASLICRFLERAGIAGESVPDARALVGELGRGAGVAVISEEALQTAEIAALQSSLSRQPPWSDLPVIVLTANGETDHSLDDYTRLRALGNVTFLERPIRTVTLISCVQAALRARERQYQTQSYITDRARAEELLVVQAQQLAQSNADLQQFAYVSSHDLQEPLRTIHAYSQLLERRYGSQLDYDGNEFLRFITGAAQRMETLIRDLLAYSRIVNAEERPFGPVAMDRVVSWALANLHSAIADSRAEITYSELPTVWGDEVKLVQLVQNLLSNAIKYHRPEEPPAIRIEVERREADWLFLVIDNGQGIKPEYRERIFGLFKRLHGRETAGTGIGLAICRRIVEQHEGRLWVESAEGPGSVFCFTMRAAGEIARQCAASNPQQ